MRMFFVLVLIFSLGFSQPHSKVVETPYQKPFKAVFWLFLESPERLKLSLGFISNIMYVLTNSPYNFSLDDIDIVVVSHGREVPVFAYKNKELYSELVDRAEILSLYGVKFKICRVAAEQVYGLSEKDFYPFVELVPSAITEVIHWQMQGHAIIIPPGRHTPP
ncbi:MAG: DsrE family protein [Aquificaceae bacterium]|nr:DsrE family protein [Aquificaceae bacterium]